jgi:hypothetical protein
MFFLIWPTFFLSLILHACFLKLSFILFYLFIFYFILFSSSLSLQAMSNIIVFLVRLFLFFSFSSSSSSSLVAGSSSSDFYLAEVFANGSSLSNPFQLWGDSLNSYVYVGRWNLYISRIAVSSRAVTLYAGTGASANHIAGAATSSPMAYCMGVCGDTAGSLYVTCITYDRIVKIDIPTGERREEREKKRK